VFLRAGWVVGEAGVPLALLIASLTSSVALLTVLGAIGAMDRCGGAGDLDEPGGGGVYPLLRRALGDRLAASIGSAYWLGQSIGVSLYAAGLGESVAELTGWRDDSGGSDWPARGVAACVTLSLLAVCGAGVKWLCCSLLCWIFLIGSIVHGNAGALATTATAASGVTGYSREALFNNSRPDYSSGESFFTVTGRVDMAGDLANPQRSVPVGSLLAVTSSWLLYVTFVLVLGATCERWALQSDPLIGQKVSLLGPLFLCGLYVSSMSAALGGLTAAARVLSAVAHNTQLPGLRVLAELKFSVQVPLYALLTVTSVSLLFTAVGNVNFLGPIVTMPFLITYATVSYAYFALAMTRDLEADRVIGRSGSPFPRTRAGPAPSQHGGATPNHPAVADEDPAVCRSQSGQLEVGAKSGRVTSRLTNRWLSLSATCLCLVAMLAIQWAYALACLALVALLYLCLGRLCPGAHPGVSTFALLPWLRAGACCFAQIRRGASTDATSSAARGRQRRVAGAAAERGPELCIQSVLQPIVKNGPRGQPSAFLKARIWQEVLGISGKVFY
uniref:AA_permease domain-containing protein n=1 Tax=Macrostomum lignano TaxID=282301 RepID=A0A1I8JSB5_9PLAT